VIYIARARQTIGNMKVTCYKYNMFVVVKERIPSHSVTISMNTPHNT
jgi:hypothetical protein